MADNAPPGWYADIQRPGWERYWDGQSWSDERRPAAPPAPQPAHQPRAKKGGSTVLKVALGVVLGIVLLVGGCTALLAIGLNQEEEHGITRAQFDSIALGTSRGAIVARYGEPEDAQTFESNIPNIGSSSSSCIYYPEKGKKVLEGATFQLCFDNDLLRSKNAYG